MTNNMQVGVGRYTAVHSLRSTFSFALATLQAGMAPQPFRYLRQARCTEMAINNLAL